MGNDSYPKKVDYTALDEKYEGYTVEYASSRSDADPDKWKGHFIASKDGSPTLSASVVNLLSSETDAQNQAIDIAKARIDEVIAKESSASGS